MLLLAVAHLHVVDTELASEITDVSRQRFARVSVGRNDASVHAKRRRYECVSEQQALYMNERQHTANFAVPLGEQVVDAVSECAANDVAPLRQVKKSAVWVLLDELVPRVNIGVAD
jgi:hypothetical protein